MKASELESELKEILKWGWYLGVNNRDEFFISVPGSYEIQARRGVTLEECIEKYKLLKKKKKVERVQRTKK